MEIKLNTFYILLKGWLLSLLTTIAFIAVFPGVIEKGSISIDLLFSFPFLLMIYPFKLIKHYPETVIAIITYIALVYVLNKKFSLFQKVRYVFFVSVGWELLGLLVMVRQMLDF